MREEKEITETSHSRTRAMNVKGIVKKNREKKTKRIRNKCRDASKTRRWMTDTAARNMLIEGMKIDMIATAPKRASQV
jgi:hypothetical protein